MSDITTTPATPLQDRPVGYYVMRDGEMIICRYRPLGGSYLYLITLPSPCFDGDPIEIEGINFFRDRDAASVVSDERKKAQVKQ